MSNFIEMKMEPKQLFRSISGFKYQLNEAIGDLADNSVDAKCTKIWITVSRSAIVIADNGSGMTKDQLASAITPWATNSGTHRAGKRGVYGIGLKSAAFSLGEKVEIHTRVKDGDFFKLELNHSDLISKTDRLFPYNPVPTEIFKSYKLSQGTVIRISNINARKVTQVAIDKLKGQIGLMFFKLIDKDQISIMINDERVESMNPLLIDLKKGSNQRYDIEKRGGDVFVKGDPKNYYYDYGKETIKFKKDDGKYTNITIHAVHIGRANHWSNSERNKYRFFLKKNVTPENELSNGLLKLDDQGIYLMRNDRLITLGGWLDIIRSNTILHHDVGCRVLIEYHSEDDDAIGVDHTKTKPDIIQNLKDLIKDQYLQRVSSDSENRFRAEYTSLQQKRQEKKASSELQSKPKAHPVWAKKDMQIEKVKEKIDPTEGRKARQEEEDHGKTAKDRDAWFEVVDSLPYNNLWQAFRNKEDNILLRMNENHKGYRDLYHEANRDKMRMNLNFLFFCFATFEADVDKYIDDLKPSEKELLARVFKDLRKFVSRRLADSDDND